MNIQGLRDHMQPFIDLVKESGVEYFWIASGAIRDYFTTGGITPKDLDIFFSCNSERDKAVSHLKLQGFKTIKHLPNGNIKFSMMNFKANSIDHEVLQNYSYDAIDICCWNGKKDPACVAKSPEECIKWFDFTVEMAALDSNGHFIHHPTFENDITNKVLVRNSLKDMYIGLNIKRLLKYIKNGYTIDSENLLVWLQDQIDTIEYRKNLKVNKEWCGSSWCKGPDK